MLAFVAGHTAALASGASRGTVHDDLAGIHEPLRQEVLGVKRLVRRVVVLKERLLGRAPAPAPRAPVSVKPRQGRRRIGEPRSRTLLRNRWTRPLPPLSASCGRRSRRRRNRLAAVSRNVLRKQTLAWRQPYQLGPRHPVGVDVRLVPELDEELLTTVPSGTRKGHAGLSMGATAPIPPRHISRRAPPRRSRGSRGRKVSSRRWSGPPAAACP